MFKFILGLVIGTIVGFFYASMCQTRKKAEEIEIELFEKRFEDGDEN